MGFLKGARASAPIWGVLLALCSCLVGCHEPASASKPEATETVEAKLAAVFNAVACPVPGDASFAATEKTRGLLAAERVLLDQAAYYRAALHFRRAAVCAPTDSESQLQEARARRLLVAALASARFSEYRAPSARTARSLRQLLGEALPELGRALLAVESQRARREAKSFASR